MVMRMNGYRADHNLANVLTMEYEELTEKSVGLHLNFGETNVLYPVILSKRALLPSRMSSYS